MALVSHACPLNFARERPIQQRECSSKRCRYCSVVAASVRTAGPGADATNHGDKVGFGIRDETGIGISAANLDIPLGEGQSARQILGDVPSRARAGARASAPDGGWNVLQHSGVGRWNTGRRRRTGYQTDETSDESGEPGPWGLRLTGGPKRRKSFGLLTSVTT